MVSTFCWNIPQLLKSEFWNKIFENLQYRREKKEKGRIEQKKKNMQS